ncbi:hypothetical protein N4X43_004400 [Salmonella enterica]|nr:hypothetical protein [Salmonella enterica]EJU5553261.1 hypothetical protein [Salmonella enterica]EKA6589025.1 hypothetical protein [Salmonella enterica]
MTNKTKAQLVKENAELKAALEKAKEQRDFYDTLAYVRKRDIDKMNEEKQLLVKEYKKTMAEHVELMRKHKEILEAYNRDLKEYKKLMEDVVEKKPAVKQIKKPTLRLVG